MRMTTSDALGRLPADPACSRFTPTSVRALKQQPRSFTPTQPLPQSSHGRVNVLQVPRGSVDAGEEAGQSAGLGEAAHHPVVRRQRQLQPVLGTEMETLKYFFSMPSVFST